MRVAEALLDTNVLVYAAYKAAPLHRSAAHLVDQGLRHRGAYCIAPQNLIEFASVVSRRRFVDPELSSNEIERMVRLLYRSRTLRKIYPKRATVMRAFGRARGAIVVGPRWYDVFLASTMLDAGVHRVITENASDFTHLPGIIVMGITGAVEASSPTAS